MNRTQTAPRSASDRETQVPRPQSVAFENYFDFRKHKKRGRKRKRKRGRPPNQKNNAKKDQMIVDGVQMNPKQLSGLSVKLEVCDSLPLKKGKFNFCLETINTHYNLIRRTLIMYVEAGATGVPPKANLFSAGL